MSTLSIYLWQGLPEPGGAEAEDEGTEPWLGVVQAHGLEVGEGFDLEVVVCDEAQADSGAEGNACAEGWNPDIVDDIAA